MVHRGLVCAIFLLAWPVVVAEEAAPVFDHALPQVGDSGVFVQANDGDLAPLWSRLEFRVLGPGEDAGSARVWIAVDRVDVDPMVLVLAADGTLMGAERPFEEDTHPAGDHVPFSLPARGWWGGADFEPEPLKASYACDVWTPVMGLTVRPGDSVERGTPCLHGIVHPDTRIVARPARLAEDGGRMNLQWDLVAPADEQRLGHWTFMEGIPYPIEAQHDLPDGGTATVRLESFSRGDGALEQRPRPQVVTASRPPWGIDEEGFGGAFPLREAYDRAQSPDCIDQSNPAGIQEFGTGYETEVLAVDHMEQVQADDQAQVERQYDVWLIVTGQRSTINEFGDLQITKVDRYERFFLSQRRAEYTCSSWNVDGARGVAGVRFIPSEKIPAEMPTVASLAEVWARTSGRPVSEVNTFRFYYACPDDCDQATPIVQVGNLVVEGYPWDYHGVGEARFDQPTPGQLIKHDDPWIADLLTVRGVDGEVEAWDVGARSMEDDISPWPRASGRPGGEAVALWNPGSTLYDWRAGAAIATGGLIVAALAWLFKGKLAMVFGFSRVPTKRLLEHPVRAALHDALAASPGLSTARLAQQIDVPEGTVRHHVRKLVDGGLVESRRVGGQRLYAPPGRWSETTPASAGAAGPLWLELNRQGPTRLQSLVDQASVSRKAVQKQVARLERLGLARTRREGGYTLVWAVQPGSP